MYILVIVVAFFSWCNSKDLIAKDVVTDLGRVVGIKYYNGPVAGRKLLKQNGFVVVPEYYHRIFSPYYESPLPTFITADSVYSTFHVIFEDQFKKV
jgi:hypothetical protein